MFNVLFVLTSHDKLGDTGHKTGFWIEEFAAPYYALTDEGVNVALASPKGGQPPIDPKSHAPENETPATKRYDSDEALHEKLSLTIKLADVSADEYDAVFFPGGHGPLWDLTNDPEAIRLVETFTETGKIVAAVCHAPAVLLQAKTKGGEPFVKGKKVTGFTNEEEEAVGLTPFVPFLLEDELKKRGGDYSKKAEWQSYAITDGQLITGQNPASSEEVALNLLEALKEKKVEQDV